MDEENQMVTPDTVTQDVDSTNDVQNDASQEESKDYSELYKNQKIRAEKAEAKLKELKAQSAAPSQEETPTIQTKQDPTIPLDEVFVIKGLDLDKDEYLYAKKISQLDGVSVSEAASGDQFKFWKKAREAEAKASMRASKGGAATSPKKTFKTPGLSDAEHKQMFNEKMGR